MDCPTSSMNVWQIKNDLVNQTAVLVAAGDEARRPDFWDPFQAGGRPVQWNGRPKVIQGMTEEEFLIVVDIAAIYPYPRCTSIRSSHGECFFCKRSVRWTRLWLSFRTTRTNPASGRCHSSGADLEDSVPKFFGNENFTHALKNLSTFLDLEKWTRKQHWLRSCSFSS